MPVDVKICGLKDEVALEAAIAGGAAYVGFVHYPPSPRSLEIDVAAPLLEAARGRAKSVVLTVDADVALLDEIMARLKPDLLQFHGAETPEQVAAVREHCGVPVMKAVKVGARDDVTAARTYIGAAEMLLFDAKPRPGEGLGLPGGNGVSFDWRLLEGVDPGLPWMLSGGLDASNVATAIAMSGATAIDVSSGVESAPGVKDAAMISSFLAAVREAEGVMV